MGEVQEWGSTNTRRCKYGEVQELGKIENGEVRKCGKYENGGRARMGK